jgi:hypothetical protein
VDESLAQAGGVILHFLLLESQTVPVAVERNAGRMVTAAERCFVPFFAATGRRTGGTTWSS